MPFFKRHSTLCIALFLWTGLLSIAQESESLADLHLKLSLAKEDSSKANILADLCFQLVNSNPDSALIFGENALEYGSKSGNDQSIGNAHNSLAWLASQQGRQQEAELHFDSALVYLRAVDNQKDISVVYSNMGWLESDKGNLVTSLKHFQASMRINEALHDSSGMANNLYAIGSAYRRTGDYEKGIAYMKKGLLIEEEYDRPSIEAACLLGIANSYSAMDSIQLAIEYYDRAEILFAESNNVNGLGLIAENLGNMYQEEEPKKALEFYKSAESHFRIINSDRDLAHILLAQGKAYLRLEDLKSARSVLERGYNLARKTGNRSLAMDYLQSRAELASRDGDSEGTYLHSQAYQALKDSLQGADTQHELARLRTEFETERKEKDNEILRIKNSEQEEKIAQRERQLLSILLIALLSLALALLFWRTWVQKKKHLETQNRLNDELSKSNAEIHEINSLLEMKLLRGQMNPHFIFNCLNSATAMAQEGRAEEARDYLQQFAHMLRTVLHHSVSDRISIEEEVTFLQEYLALEKHRMPSLNFTFIVDPELIEEVAKIPSLLVQPFVENAIHHGFRTSDQGEVHVQFGIEGDSINCSVEDNGMGRKAAGIMTESNDHHSLGMQLTNERLRLLAKRLGAYGSFKITDLKDDLGKAKGTRVVITLPFE